MNSQELLDDLITERSQVFDEELLAGTLNAVRRRRKLRHVGNAAMAVTTLIVLAVGWMKYPVRQESPGATIPAPPVPGYLVHTKMLSGRELVLTQSGSFTRVATAIDPSLVVHTVASPDLYQLINDVELRMLLAEHNPVLLRQPNRRPLLLLDGKPVGVAFEVN